MKVPILLVLCALSMLYPVVIKFLNLLFHLFVFHGLPYLAVNFGIFWSRIIKYIHYCRVIFGWKMGKRKSRAKPAPKKRMDKLDSFFSCPFCNHGSSVECRMWVLLHQFLILHMLLWCCMSGHYPFWSLIIVLLDAKGLCCHLLSLNRRLDMLILQVKTNGG